MSLPEGVPTVTLTFGPYTDATGAPLVGERVEVAPPAPIVHLATGATVVPAIVRVPLNAEGGASVDLVATDAPGMDRTGWTYTVRVPSSIRDRRTSLALPAATPVVSFDRATPTDARPGTPLVPVDYVQAATTQATLAAQSATDADVAATAATQAATLAGSRAATASAAASDAAGYAQTAATGATQASDAATSAAASAVTASQAAGTATGAASDAAGYRQDALAAAGAAQDASGVATQAAADAAATTVTSGTVVGDILRLERTDGTTVDAGNVRGPKGDTGGWATTTVLTTQDLDTIWVPGLYSQGTGANATLDRHYPASPWRGYIEVIRLDNSFLMQRATGLDSTNGSERQVYYRTRTAGVWGPWYPFHLRGAIGGGDLTGTGFPEGVVTASPGTYYTDTAGTNGAWRWLKKSGTGSTGWAVVIGDTGWRALARWDNSGTVTGTMPARLGPRAGVSGGVFIRRTGEHTRLAVVEAVATGADPEILSGDMVGFRSSATMPFPAVPFYYRSSDLTPRIGNIEAGVSVIRFRGPVAGDLLTPAGTGGYGVQASWITDRDFWPWTLPGTAAV